MVVRNRGTIWIKKPPVRAAVGYFNFLSYFISLVGKERANTFYFLVDFVFKFARGPEDIVVAVGEVRGLGRAHLCDQVEKFS